ncbi:hypothetical protein P148_SR1C00001G0737 [candidate division SR1 bacterium RAAC1_SR1_1]|nr:hypothetical protein P148_SR1C00001G0737 [candidate division SR1 bacterium RAAC1_SR1_1]
MKKLFSRLLYSSILFGAIFLGQYSNAQSTQGQIALEIKRGFLTIAGSGALNIGSISSNPSIEERTISVENILQIRDIAGLCNGHYTTLQFSDLSNGSEIISNQNITMNLQSITKILGKDNTSLSLGLIIDNQRGATKNSTTHIYRSIGTNCGYIGQYGTTGDIKINIPANQSAGTYRGKIYYLLIDNN